MWNKKPRFLFGVLVGLIPVSLLWVGILLLDRSQASPTRTVATAVWLIIFLAGAIALLFHWLFRRKA